MKTPSLALQCISLTVYTNIFVRQCKFYGNIGRAVSFNDVNGHIEVTRSEFIERAENILWWGKCLH